MVFEMDTSVIWDVTEGYEDGSAHDVSPKCSGPERIVLKLYIMKNAGSESQRFYRNLKAGTVC